MGKKACKNLFETDLRKERSPYMGADDQLRSWVTENMSNCSKLCPVSQLLPAMGCPIQLCNQPKMVRMDSYRVPPLKTTLETIEEDKPRYERLPDYLLRSKSLPAQRRYPVDRNGLGLKMSKLPSYRRGHEGRHLVVKEGEAYCAEDDHGPCNTSVGDDGTYFAGSDRGREGGDRGSYGVSMSGPILSTPGGEYCKSYSTSKSGRYRPRSISIARMREVVRQCRFRGTLSHIFSRMRPTGSRGRSH